MWLLRGLSFTCKALQNSQADKTQELSAAFGSSYEATLKKFHGMLTRPIFAVSHVVSFFSVAVVPAPPRPPEVERREGGKEPGFIHICGSAAATFFFLG